MTPPDPETPPAEVPLSAPGISARPTRGGAAFLLVMGLLLAGAGSLFTWGLWHAGQRAMETRSWTPVPCRITFSSVYPDKYSANDPLKWRASIQYAYTWEGRAMTGDHVRRVEGPSPHKARAEEIVKNYPAGMDTQCWVNPSDPSHTVLEHDSKAAFYTLWWPLLFVTGGIGIMAAALRRVFQKRSQPGLD